MVPVFIFFPPQRFIHSKISMEHIKENFFCLPFVEMIISHDFRNTLRFLYLIQLPEHMMGQAFVQKKNSIFGIAGGALTGRKQGVGIRVSFFDVFLVFYAPIGDGRGERLDGVKLCKPEGVVQQFI